MAQVSIFHNVSRDASFGLNTVFRTSETEPETGSRVLQLSDGRYMWKECAEARGEMHELVWVFQYTVDTAGTYDVYALLNQAFETFNIGSDELAAQYRARKLRSLSVGDVVLVDDNAYACGSVGWSPASKDDLRILPASEADKVIRDRYEFKPVEALSVTVPLPD